MPAATRPNTALPRHRWARIMLAGPGSIVVTLTLLAGMPLWLPEGAAGIDNIAFPLVFAPLIWAVLFFHACLDRSVSRVALVSAALLLAHGGIIVTRLVSATPAVTSASGNLL